MISRFKSPNGTSGSANENSLDAEMSLPEGRFRTKLPNVPLAGCSNAARFRVARGLWQDSAFALRATADKSNLRPPV